MYPVTYAADYVSKRSRLTTFFRYVLLIPHMIVAFFWGIALYLSVIVSWFALLFTARYPQALYDFNASGLRFWNRMNGYAGLLTDAFPPFHGNDADGYPVRVGIAPPKEEYSRLKVFFRVIVGIPVVIMSYIYGLVVGFVSMISWVVIVVTGAQPRGLQDLLRMGSAYNTKAMAYFMLLTEDYPPITDRPELESVPPSAQLGGAG